MTALNAKNLTLSEVLRLLKFQKLPNGSFTPLLSLEPLTEFEQQELIQTCEDFDSYLTDGKVSDGEVKLVSVGPLLLVGRFYRSPIKMFLEEGIADIAVEDEGANYYRAFGSVSDQQKYTHNYRCTFLDFSN